jgi:hypothetical protein
MTGTPKLPVAGPSRHMLLRGAACPEGGARIMLLMTRSDEPSLPHDLAACSTSPTDEPAAAKPS